MSPDNRSLILDLVEWVARGPRPYGEVMDAWRTSCPRLTIWEDAVDAGLVTQFRSESGTVLVTATEKGRTLLEQAGRSAPAIGGGGLETRPNKAAA